MDQEAPIVCALGRFGDVLNALPIAYALYKDGRTPKFVISKEFESALSAVSYVTPRAWSVDYKEIPRVIEKARGKELYVCQCYKHPDQRRLTDSYQKESWRVAGWLDRFGTIPLVLDNRNREREKAADLKYCLITPGYHAKKKTILVAGKSVSSPFPHDVVEILRTGFPECNVIDLCSTRIEHPFDLLGMMESAACLVTVDTFHLHLARACEVPTIAVINEGWFGSCLTSRGAHKFVRYSQFSRSQIVGDASVLLNYPPP